MARYQVGVDVGKRRHVACAWEPVSGAFSKPFAFPVDREGFAAFAAWLGERSAAAGDFLIGVEATGPYGETLVRFLLGRGYAVVAVDPHRAAQFRRAQGRKAKTDRLDARSLAGMLGLAQQPPLAPPDAVREELRELTRFRHDLVRDRTALINSLHEALTVAFPEFAAQVSELNSPTTLAILLEYPTPGLLKEAGVDTVAATIERASRGHLGRELARRLVKAADNSVGVAAAAASRLKVTVLAERIAELNGAVDRVEAEIEALFPQLGLAVSAFPVGGTVSLATLLAEIGDIRRFPTLKQFLSHFGWCPRTFQSGGYTSQHPKLSRAGNRYARRILWLLAVSAVRGVPRYRDYFERRTSEGKNKMDTLVAIGRKLLSVIHAILKTGKPYDPDYLKRSKQPQPVGA